MEMEKICNVADSEYSEKHLFMDASFRFFCGGQQAPGENK